MSKAPTQRGPRPIATPSAAGPMAQQRLPLRLRLHGHAVVTRGSDSVLALRGRAAAVVALAALEPGILRERVAAMLWADAPDPRQNLRQQLLRFRQALGTALIDGGHSLRLATGIELMPADDGIELLGDELAGDDEFGHWLARQRDTARRARREPLQQALLRAETEGEFDVALQQAQALLALEPFEESHHCALMRLHYLRGESASGLAAYRQLEAMLAARYATQPSPAATELAAALRRAGSAARVDTSEPAGGTRFGGALVMRQRLPVTLKRPPHLVGRQAERAAVTRAWAAGQAVLLEGEAGLGKSRLIDALLAESMATMTPPATSDTPATLAAAGRPGDAGTPYATLVRLLRPLLDAHATDRCQADEAMLAQALGLGPAGTTPVRTVALAAAVERLFTRHAVVLVAVDDLHFADDGTIELLTALVAFEPRPWRWLLAQRPAEGSNAARALHDSLTESQRLAAVALAPLDAPAVAALVDDLDVPGLASAEMTQALVRHTGGNPLFLLETLKLGLADGSLADGRLPRPDGVGALIELRLRRLSAPALALARVAAIAGVDFGIELAEAALGQSAVQLASAWQELQDAQVLRDESFAHDLVADAVRRGVPPVVARRVHVQCAQWLATHGGEPARLAWQWQHGGRPAEAATAFVAAARRAELASRGHEEATLYGHAAEAFAAAGMGAERFDALCDRVAALVGADFGDTALAEARALATAATDDAQRLRAHRELASLLTERSQLDEAIVEGQAGMTLARRIGDDEAQVRIACHLATALCRLGRAVEAHALLLPMRPWVESQDDDRVRMLWHGDMASTLGHMGRLHEAVLSYGPALVAARRIGWRAAEGRLMLNHSVTLRQMGRFDRALAVSREGRAMVAGDAGTSTDEQIAALVLARDESEAAAYAPALSALESLLPQFEAAGTGFWWQACRMVLAQLWLHLGQHARAIPLLRDEPVGLPPWLRTDRCLLRMELAHAMEQALPTDALPSARELALTDPNRGLGARVRALRATPAAEVLDQADALAVSVHAQERFGALLALRVHVARAALAEGRTDAAAAAARSALALFDDGFAPESMYRAEAWWVASRALAAAGAAAEAEHALRQGSRWVRQTVLPQVPAAFIDSFLHRNRVNRDLLAAAARLGDHG